MLGLWGGFSGLVAQTLGFSIASETAPPGDTVDLPITVMHFDSISGYQGTLTWDTTLLNFIEIASPTAGHNNIVGNPGQGAIPQNAATFLWVDFSGGSKTYADSTPLLEIRFAIKPNAPQVITNVLMNSDVTALGYSQGSGLQTPTINPGIVNINGCLPTADPGFSYPSALCPGGQAPLPTVTGDPGGTFSVNNGASIDSLTGALDLTSVIPGTPYLITYQVGAPCPAFGSQQVQILLPDDASFSVVDTTCFSGSVPAVTVAGLPGGTFSVDNGALIDPQTGLLDLSSTQPGTTYTLTYTTNGTCPNTAAQSLFIQPADDAGFLLPDTVCVNASNPIATVTGLPGGTFSVDQGATIDPLSGQLDLASVVVGTTYQVSYQTAGPCPAQQTQSLFIQPPADASFTLADTVCPGGPNPLPLITGLPGGTFSVDNGALIDAQTGELDLASTTNGQSYTITYSLTGGCAASTQQQLTVIDQQAPLAPSLPILTGSCDLQIPFPTTQDNCAGTLTGSTSDPLQYTLNGTYTVNWTFDDGNGNQTTAPQTIVIQDAEAPQAICQNLTVSLDTSGTVTITPAGIDGGSFDNCEIGQMSLSQETFTTADLGVNAVILTVTDVNGNSSTCAAVVTVINFAPPVAQCLDVAIFLNSAGQATLTPALIDGGSTVGFGAPQLSASQTQFFCEDEGLNFVTLYVEDGLGIMDSCVAEVTVLDTLPPFPLLNNVTLYLDSVGTSVLTVAEVDQGSFDACELDEISLAQDTFGCADLGTSLVEVTLTDIHGNERVATTGVTVLDTIPPTVVCQDLSVELDSQGVAMVAPSLVDAGSFDACGIAGLSLSQSTFTAADLGENEVMLTATDPSGNQDSCLVRITVTDIASSQDPWALTRLQLYPNPAGDWVQLSWDSDWRGPVEVVLYNQLGQVVWHHRLAKYEQAMTQGIDLRGLAKGVYALQLSAHGWHLSRRLVRE